MRTSDYTKNRNLMIGSFTVNKFAETIFYLTIIWYIYDVTNSTIATTFYSIISITSSVFLGPIVGVFAERKAPKTVVQYCFALISVIGLVLALLFYLEISYLLILIYVFTFIHTILTMTSGISRGRLIGQIAPKENIPQLSGLLTSFGSVANMTGNAAAGFLLLIIGYSGIIVVQAGGYLLSVILILLIVVNLEKQQSPTNTPVQKPNFLKELVEGMKEFRKNRPVFKLIIIGSMINVLSIGSASLVVLIQEQFQAGAKEYGLFHAAGTIATLIVGISAGKLFKTTRPGVMFATCLFSVGISMLLISVTTHFWVGTLWFMIIAGAEVFMLISINSMLIILVEERFRARVMSLAISISNVFMPLGMLFNAFIADYFAIKYVYVIVGIWVLLWAMVVLFSKDLRSLSFENSSEAVNQEEPSLT